MQVTYQPAEANKQVQRLVIVCNNYVNSHVKNADIDYCRLILNT